MPDLSAIPADRHVLIAGPTASGKSSLAMDVAREQGGLIVNADALQVWSCWRVLTARPSVADETALPHALYGHVTPERAYSVGDWLDEVAPLSKSRRLIVVGGTGLYLTALTEGLAPIPPVPAGIRAEGDALLNHPEGLTEMIAALDARTAGQIDLRNPARVQRAWEVLQATGRGLAAWQADTPGPLIDPADATCLVLDANRDWLAERIARRFRVMIREGAMDEARRMAPQWSPRAQWARAIGAPELIAHLDGQLTLDAATEAAITATRQYAKAQRSWFRNRMKRWTRWSIGD